MTEASRVPRQARPVRGEWQLLAAATPEPAAFGPAVTAGLPEPARRWLAHAIPPGTPLWRTAELVMRGTIKLGGWRPFTARQVLAPPEGYIWAATARLMGLPVTGYDRLSSGSGQMRWRLLGVIPVLAADGPDITRSAAGRLAGEVALVPTTFQQARWEQADGDTVIASLRIGDDTETARLRIGTDGRLVEILVNRWGNPDGAPFRRHTFGVSVQAESAFGGITIPSRFRAGWWYGTGRQEEGEFFRAHITAAVFR